MDFFDTIFDTLFNKLDMQAIAAIIGICYAIQKTLEGLKLELADRFMPLAPLGMGVLVAFYRADEDWELWAIYYAGGASVAYNILWTTVLNKVNLAEMVANLLLRWKEKKGGL